jgi:hypothetical protein
MRRLDRHVPLPHFRGDPSPGGQRELYDACHEAAVAWCEPPGRFVSPADAAVLGRALADAEADRRSRARPVARIASSTRPGRASLLSTTLVRPTPTGSWPPNSPASCHARRLVISDHDHYGEYAELRHHHDDLERDYQTLQRAIQILRDHDHHEYAERRHRHRDLEDGGQGLRREIASLREAFRELRSDLEDAFARISALDGKGPATSAGNRPRRVRPRRFQPGAGRYAKTPQRVGITARRPTRWPGRTPACNT